VAAGNSRLDPLPAEGQGLHGPTSSTLWKA
jgi:hypothetical protein